MIKNKFQRYALKVDKRNKWSVGTTQSLVLTKETLVNESRFNHQRGRTLQDQRVKHMLHDDEERSRFSSDSS